MNVQRIAAFSQGTKGGNPAGVVLCETLPPADRMLATAAEVGFSETVFAARGENGWLVRYFSPEIEVPFCGHATIALGAALALAHGDGTFTLQLNDTRITVTGSRNPLIAALQSPRTRNEQVPEELVETALDLFSYTVADLDPRLPPAIIEAGARHLVLALTSRQKLATMRYDLEQGRRFMMAAGIVTIALVHAETNTLFHARNPFAVGGVYEDPATGAAAAALAGYLRDLGWPHGGMIEILQGEDMGMPSRLKAEITSEPGASIRVSGEARQM
ncbi:PhzF family phenazine biosynthesis protein [Bradyrhizobium sp. STM 3557]|uniref:PhzF family phenazine biosynthesis protein n=1 Tax=Bradyrhizobium sp. STM 3557 TaxID=578920 RepID=UPI00388D643E